jgi:hypothetical protein
MRVNGLRETSLTTPSTGLSNIQSSSLKSCDWNLGIHLKLECKWFVQITTNYFNLAGMLLPYKTYDE